MTKRIRDPDELKRAFEIQCKALRSSCKAYDEGERWEAIRIATVVHTLVHDGGKNNKSLLTQMGKKGSTQFIASGHPINPKNLIADTPLVMIHIGGAGGGGYVPALGERPHNHRPIRFEEWWERDYVFRSGDNAHRLTRKKLTFALRNQDGGSHFDAVVLDPNYIEMTHGQTWILSSGGVERPMRELELATMRQVGWELNKTFELAGLV